MKSNENRKVFPLTSRLIFAPALLEQIPERELMDAFARHDTGDWGLVSKVRTKLNKASLRHGGELVSEYAARNGVRFKVVTSEDSRVTRFATIHR